MQAHVLCKDILNTRELAILFWIGTALIWLYFHPNTRRSITDLMKAIFVKEILLIYALAAIYIWFCVWTFDYIGLGDYYLMKDVIWWFIFVATVTLFKLNKIVENKNYFRSAVKDNFKLTFFLDFLVGLYTFYLWIEILLIPIPILIGGMLAFTDDSIKYVQLKKGLKGLLIGFGLVLLSYLLFQLAINLNQFISFSTLGSLFLPPLLSILFLPFLYIISLYMVYEAGFQSISLAVKSPYLISFSKKQAFRRFNFNIEGFNRWRFGLFNKNLISQEDIIESINSVKELQQIEKNPPKVAFEKGWSPYSAKNFLLKSGISTGFYSNPFDDEWQASSNYIKLNTAVIEDNASFYVFGSKSVVTSLKLSMNVYDPDNSSNSHLLFLRYSRSLYLHALGSLLPTPLSEAITKGEFYEYFNDGIVVLVEKNHWNNINRGYSFDLEIRRIV